MTDGVADDFFPEAERLAALFDGNPVLDLEASQGRALRGVVHEVLDNPRDGQALAEWLQYQKRGSSDDRTLLLLYRQGADTTGSSVEKALEREGCGTLSRPVESGGMPQDRPGPPKHATPEDGFAQPRPSNPKKDIP
jgi:hypothetical protein